MVTALISLSVAEAALYASHLFNFQVDMLSGWGLAFMMHGIGLFLFTRSVGAATDRFILLSLGGIFTRLFVLIIFSVIVLVGGVLRTGPFLIGLLTAYFAGSWMEIALLAKPVAGGGFQRHQE